MRARLAALVLSAGLAGEAVAETPHVILFGGGWGAEGTQASIEAHVEALQRVLPAAKVLFAAGNKTVRAVQIAAPKEDEVGALLATIFDRRDNAGVTYRPSALAAARASKAQLLETLRAAKDDAAGTIVIGAGHGNGAAHNQPATIELWGPDDRLAVDELAKHLDGHERKSAITFMFGHCFSGAFTEIAHEAADPKQPLAQPARCVFAAVPGDREAAGCTPDLADADARAYLAMIGEAFAKPADADLDKDGKVAAAEAHAYARVHDRTVDVPVSSSETFIARTLGARAPRAETAPLAKLLPKARATERAVIDALAPPKRDARAARAELEHLHDKSDRLADELDDLDADRERVRRSILDVVLERWPELANPYHAESRRLLAGDAAEVVAAIRAQKALGELRERDLSIHEKERERLEVERRAARLERWLRAIEAVAGEDALRRSRNRRVVEGLDRLLACEAAAPG